MHDKQLAKQIIVEIIRQAGGVFDNKTNLFKAFYHAHLQYARSNPGVLSSWRIVRMPNGPGIDQADRLLGELAAEGLLEIDQIKVGQCTAFRFRLTQSALQVDAELSPQARDAIGYGVSVVKDKTAARVSHDSHIQSPSWRDASDGEELPIYADLLTDDEYADAKARAERSADILRRLSAG